MNTMNGSGPLWRKSRHSNGQASCVEVGQVGPAVAVRDTKDPDGPAVAFSQPAWQEFTRRLKAGAADTI